MQRFDVATHVIDETIDTADYGNNGGVNAMTIVDGHLWLTTPQASVLELNAATGEYLRTVNLPDIDANISGQRASAIAGDSNSIWVADLNAYDRIDQNSGTLLQTTDASSGEIAQPYAIADDGTNVWMTLQASNQVLELDARTGAVVQTIALPSDASNPRDIASDGKTVAVVTQEGQLILIDASSGVISGDLGSGANINDGVGVINGCAWMATNSYTANDPQESGNQIAEFCP
jgi:outer membrane protein assembly factor BamB